MNIMENKKMIPFSPPDISELEINEENAEAIWDWCNEYIKLNNVTPQRLIEQSNVSHLFTTNEAIDDLLKQKMLQEEEYLNEACITVTEAGRRERFTRTSSL